jgi:hypothetical protein
MFHLVGGRGVGKSIIVGVKALQVMLDEPGTRGCILSPTYQKLRDIFLAAWEDIIPPELYRINRSEMTINLINGSRVYLRSRQVNNPGRGKFALKGIDVSWIIDDEAAEGFNMEVTTNALASCRRPGRNRFYACVTTPLLNEYHQFATSDGHQVIHCTSWDNPHIEKEFLDQVEAHMSPQQAKRELYGQWVALEGRCWDTWSNKPWPKGNIHDYTYNPDFPVYLWLDLGVGNGAFLAVQPVPAEHLGRRIYSGSVWVVVGEFTPKHDGSADRAFQRFSDFYGQPAGIVTGSDVDTRGTAINLTPHYFASQTFPGTPVYPIKGWVADKQIQYSAMLSMIFSVSGERRLCISRDLRSFDKEANRGVKEVIEQDQWPEGAGKHRSTLFNKEGRLEHVRDALLYGCTHINPPQMMPGRKPG